MIKLASANSNANTSANFEQLSLLFAVTLNVLPHSSSVPIGCSLVALFFIIWRALHLYRGIATPNRYLTSFFAILGSSAIFYYYGTLLGAEPASALLVFLVSLKLLESSRYRDAMLIIFTCYFLLVTYLVEAQSLLATAFMLADVLLLTSLLMRLHNRDRRVSLRSYRPAAKLFALALPMWIFLFLIFPRFSTGLWNTGGAQASSVGFSDQLNPGDVAKIVESQSPAFRVVFPYKNKPSPEDMYWRGAILTESRGLTWKRSHSLPLAKTTASTTSENPTDRTHEIIQEISLEPGYQHWLFALDYPFWVGLADEDKIHPSIISQNGFVYEKRSDIATRFSYQAHSNLRAPNGKLSATERAIDLQLPKEAASDQLLRLVSKIKLANPKARDRVQAVLNYFKIHDFRYTLAPGQMQNGLEEFLFVRKMGFCEHYAAAFSTLMRMLEVPSRVVVGFQGATFNRYDSYWLVRASDAHAWSEIWSDEENRWQRVDPTATIAPLRIELGGSFNQLSEQQAETLAADQARAVLNAHWLGRIAQNFSLIWDATSNRYDHLLAQYDFNYQKNLLEKVGLPSNAGFVLSVIALIGLVGFLIALQFYLRQPAKATNPALALYEGFCKKLAKAGLPKKPEEGPFDFAQRIQKTHPLLAPALSEITNKFIQLYYGPQTESEDLMIHNLRKDIRSFSATKRNLKGKQP
jgi:transglutaminase-like putative cysteine protease